MWAVAELERRDSRELLVKLARLLLEVLIQKFFNTFSFTKILGKLDQLFYFYIFWDKNELSIQLFIKIIRKKKELICPQNNLSET